MAKKTLGGVEIEIDEDGFIQEPEKWNKAVAEDIAKEESDACPMDEDHWKLVDYLRNYYIEFGIAPAIRMLTKKTGFDLKYMYVMFPKGPAAGACKVAGLPKPTGCV
jgi:TusE/DsrC/DsvC family sulfur relay protein